MRIPVWLIHSPHELTRLLAPAKAGIGILGIILLAIVFTITTVIIRADTGTCGGVITTVPFLDVTGSPFFCQIAGAYFSGLTNGTSAGTYSPYNAVTREQMAAFVTRTLDQSLSRGSPRAAVNQWWIPRNPKVMEEYYFSQPGASFADIPHRVQSDGTSIWVSGEQGLYHMQLGNEGQYNLHDGTSPVGAGRGIVMINSKACVARRSSGRGVISCYVPWAKPPLTEWAVPDDALFDGLAFDGNHIWVGSESGRISRIRWGFGGTASFNTPGFSQPRNLIYDGTNLWATDFGNGSLFKLGADAQILQTVSVGANPLSPAFDGTNLWVPNYGSGTVTIVRASTGAVVTTLTGNGLVTPSSIAFDGERMLVTNESNGTVSLFKATDLSPIGSFTVGLSAVGACSDGKSFWIADYLLRKVVRF